MKPQGSIESDLIDLRGYSLREVYLQRNSQLEQAVQRVLSQVERPRTNLGSSGPPGRAD